MRKPVILYTYPVSSSFIVQDIDTFQEAYSVKEFRFQPSNKLLLPLSLIRQKIFLIFNISSSDILICQFAGYHSLLPVIFAKIFRRPCLIVVGGTDCISIPSINYGNFRKPVLGWFTRKSLKNATHITAPSESLIESNYTYKSIKYPNQGFRNFDRSIKTPCTVIHNGINTSHFVPVAGVERKKNKFLTICTIIDHRNYLLKGLDLFVEAAIYYPDCEFTIIGRISKGFDIKTPDNLTLTDFIPNEMLPAKISEYTYYCQFSMSEGFGVALAEAMACGCVPIVSNVGIMGYIVGDSGFVLGKHDTALLKSLIHKAFNCDTGMLSLEAQNRIAGLFSNKKRSSEFLELISKMLN